MDFIRENSKVIFCWIAYIKLENEIFDSTITITTPWFFKKTMLALTRYENKNGVKSVNCFGSAALFLIIIYILTLHFSLSITFSKWDFLGKILSTVLSNSIHPQQNQFKCILGHFSCFHAFSSLCRATVFTEWQTKRKEIDLIKIWGF